MPSADTSKKDGSKQVFFSDQSLTIEDIDAVSRGVKSVLDSSETFKLKINKSVQFLERILDEDGVIYGVTTGYGDSCQVTVPAELTDEMSLNLIRMHGCGLGNFFSTEISRAIMAVRLSSLIQGVSSIRHKVLSRIVHLLNENIIPLIPEEGSVGASGDLTPLSYLAAVLVGERKVSYNNEVHQALDIFNKLDITPLTLRPKESLAIMNGTAAMTAVACKAYMRSEYLIKLASRISALVSIAINGNASHFDEELFKLKPHPGQAQVARWISSDLHPEELPRNSSRLQDQYSVRCAPHIIGVLQDAMPMFRSMIEIELNSANDNPLIDRETGRIFHGGHFYGGHIAFAMDSMKTCVANIADLLDRQLALIMDTKFNRGLPGNLTGAKGEKVKINHGFKAVQIAASAWTAEALKLTMPASVFSRSTECHNQDKVSMGTIASRDCLRVIELTEQVTVAALLASCQAVELRCRDNSEARSGITDTVKQMMTEVFNEFNLVIEDRPLDSDFRHFIKLVHARKFKLYSD